MKLPFITNEKNSLVSRIDDEKRKAGIPSDKKKIKYLFNSLYFPSGSSLIIIIILVLITFALTHYIPIINIPHLTSDANHYQNLIAILAGVGSIIFALLIFIAESMRDDNAKDRARVLLRESYLFPLTVAEIMVFFIFIWGTINILSLVPVIVIGFLTIFSLKRTIQVLLSNHRFAQKRIELLQDRIRQVISKAFDERRADNILFEEIESQNMAIRYSFFSQDNKSGYYNFVASRTGIIADIYLDRLKQFAELVDQYGEKNGFTFKNQNRQKIDITKTVLSDNVESTNPIQKTRFNTNDERYLFKKYHDKVEDGITILFSIHKSLIKDDPKILRELNNLSAQVFQIKLSEDSFSEEIRSELSGVKDQFITAIINKQIGKVEELRKLYLALARGFLEFMKTQNISYSLEDARKERGFIFGGWEAAEWLSSDIRDIFIKAMESDDGKIIRQVGLLPIAIARLSFEYRDQYLFQDFIQFSYLLYTLSGPKEQFSKTRYFMLTTYFSSLKEFVDYIIVPNLTKEEVEEIELIRIKDFAIYFLLVFQQLLKQAFDAKDLESYQKLFQIVRKLFKGFEPDEQFGRLRHLEHDLKSRNIETNSNKLLQIQNILKDISNEIEKRKQQMFFGLSSWILYKYRNNKSDTILKMFFETSQDAVPKKLIELTHLFLSVHDFETRDFWNWDQWEMNYDEEVHWIDSWGKLDFFYCVKALNVLEKKTAEEIQRIKLPISRDFDHMIETSGPLIKVLDEFHSNPSEWIFVLSLDATEKIPLLKSLFDDVRKRQQEAEAKEVRRANISKSKISEFKEKIVEGFYDSTILRNVLKTHNLYRDELGNKPPDNSYRFGVNVLVNKDAFIDNSHIHYIDWGTGFGRDIALGEDLSLFKIFSQYCSPILEKDLELTLNSISDLSKVIILAFNLNLHEFFKISHKFKSTWESGIYNSTRGHEGFYLFKEHKIPIYEIYHRNDNEEILILNLSKLGMLHQCSPLNENEEAEFIQDIFYINIQAFSENRVLTDSFLNKPPMWLSSKGEKDKQQEYLEENVLVHIFERYEFKKHENFEGFLIRLETKNT